MVVSVMASIVLDGTGVESWRAAAASPGSAQLAFTRVAGPDRFATAAMLATTGFPAGASSAIIATAFDFPDALSANYLAGRMDAPVLLVNPSGPLPIATLGALRTLRTQSVTILGLADAVGQDVQKALAATPTSAPGGGNLHVIRIGGQDRYDTMNLVDETPGVSAVGTVAGERTAIVASGTRFPDALAAGVVSYAHALPLVLTDPSNLSPAAAQTLQDLAIQQVLIVGGPQAVSPATEAAIHGLGMSTLARFAGSDRSDTARLVGDYAIRHLGFSGAQFDVASGDDALTGADALALAPIAARQGPRSIQLLQSSTQAGPGAAQFVRDNVGTLAGNNANLIAGGQAAVPDVLISPMVVAYETGTGVTALPELVGAQIVEAPASGAASAGTVIRYVFDEAVRNPQFDHFFAYDYLEPGLPFAGTPGPASALDPVNPDAVLVNFPRAASPSIVTALSVATVIPGAVLDDQGSTNPVGSSALGDPKALTPGGGATDAPNLESIGSVRRAGAATSAIDLAFDKPAFSQFGGTADGFTVVYTDQSGSAQEAVCQAPGSTNNSPSGGSLPGGNGTATWTIVCPDDPSRSPGALTSSEIARSIVRAGAVGSGPPGTVGNVIAAFIQAADAPRTSSMTPDLVAAVLVPGTAFGATDGILMTFDQAVDDQSVAPPATPPQAARIFAVLIDGTAVPALAAFRSLTDPTQVVATFGPGVDASAVAVALQAGAVDGQRSPGANSDDELAVANTPSVTLSPGQTAGPALSAASMNALTVSGVLAGEAILLSFDQPLGGPPSPSLAGIHGYDPDGTELTCKASVVGSGSNGLDASDNPFPDASAPATMQCDSWAVGPVSSGPYASLAQQQAIVLVTVDRATVANVAGEYNPEVATVTSGGTGTPIQG
ncbi:MAG TPA: cell wall-binding repeat-containing protein [Acidimicrobiales bacterium]|nr:cell wall-binding repeat-containing protein [Acidimicrobiales bacterium]